MLLKDSKGQIFQLKVHGYQYSEERSDPSNANRLIIGLIMTTSGQTKALQHPCLQLSEIVKLANWLAKIDNGEEPEPQLSFLEPTIRFIHLKRAEEPKLRVLLITDSGEHQVDFNLAELNLSKAIKALRANLLLYPVRAN